MTRRRLFALLFVLFASILASVLFAKRQTNDQRNVPSLPASSTATAAASAAPLPQPSWPTPFSVELRGLPPKEALPPNTLRILVLGDSVAKFLGLAMRYRQDEKQAFVAERGVGNCSIFEPTAYIENGKKLLSSSCSMSWADDVAELHPDVTLIVMGGGFFSETACSKKFSADYQKRLFDLTRAIGKNAGQIVITRVPYPIKAWRHSNVLERVDCFNKMLELIAQEGHWPVLDLMQYVCPTRDCRIESEGKPIRPDGLHFDGGGAEDTARWVLGELAGIHAQSRQ